MSQSKLIEDKNVDLTLLQ